MTKKEHFEIESSLFINLFDAMPFNVYVTDINSYDLIFVNQRLDKVIKSFDNKKCFQAIYQKEAPCEHCTVKKLLDPSGKPSGETLVTELFNDVDDQWYQLQDKCISWPDGRIAKYTIGVNITQQKQTQNNLAEAHAELALKNKQLEKISITDPLTQLYNRLKTDELIAQEITRSNRYDRPLSLIIIDLDNFKLVNDEYGHLTGDQVLIQTATVIKTLLRENDSAGRWGGEEFLVLCPETDLEDASGVAEKLRKALQQSEFEQAGSITGSFGVATYKNKESLNNFIARADKALYQAKHQGRNRVVTLIG